MIQDFYIPYHTGPYCAYQTILVKNVYNIEACYSTVPTHGMGAGCRFSIFTIS